MPTDPQTTCSCLACDPKQGEIGRECTKTVITSYLVWSNEHNCWWRPGAQGYTNHIADAGRYSRDEAIKICRGANYMFPKYGLPQEIMMPEQDAIDCLGERPKEECTW